MDETIERALALFSEEYACSQALLMAFAPELGLDVNTAARLASPFGGGIARTGQVCGALTGAMMVLGLRHGSATPTDLEAKETTYDLARDLMQRFRLRHGSIYCRDLLGCDLSTPEGLQRVHDLGLTETKCPVFVREAAEMTRAMLDSGG